MKLQNQVCSLELAKRLKELGVKQDSLFAWYVSTDIDDEPSLNRHPDMSCIACGHPTAPYYEWISAFTVAELGEMLPKEYQVVKDREDWFGWKMNIPNYELETMFPDEIIGKTEADARAKMLIYLLEKKLITL